MNVTAPCRLKVCAQHETKKRSNQVCVQLRQSNSEKKTTTQIHENLSLFGCKKVTT